jgi:hypothetical protein
MIDSVLALNIDNAWSAKGQAKSIEVEALPQGLRGLTLPVT